MIHKIRKNIMGTVSFSAKFPGMRKEQEFIAYPMQDSGQQIKVQSDTRMGMINFESGKVCMSVPHSGGAYFIHLQTDKLKVFDLSIEEIQTLKMWIKSTGGVSVGSAHCYSDNTGAIAL